MNPSILNRLNATHQQRVVVNVNQKPMLYKVKSVGNVGVTLEYSKIQTKANGETYMMKLSKGTPKTIKIKFNEFNEGRMYSGFAAGECHYNDEPVYLF